MKPAKPRPPPTLSQRVQDTAERLSTLAKAEIYQVLEGTAPAGDFSSFYRLDPLINDIVLQLIDNFKQAVTKRLLPEACKLLGSRPAALATPDPWTGGEAPQPQSPGALPTSVKQHTHLENDILALGLSPGTGQPLRPDQGPPQDAASAAASSLLQGTTVSASGSTPQPPSLSTPPSASASSGGGSGASAALHPQESRFAFANAGGGDSRRTATLQSPLSRDGAYAAGGGGGGGAATDLGQAADPLLFLGLGDSGTPLGFSSGGDAAAAAANGLAIAVDSFLLGSSLAGSIGSGAGGGSSGGGGRVTPGGGTFTPVTSPSPNSVSRQYGTLSLGGVGVGGSAAAAAIRSASSAASSPSPNPSTPSPYPALPLAIRPGSSLDPGLATPPLSLAGTEPLRGPSHGLQLHLPQAGTPQQQQQQQSLGRLSTPGDMSLLARIGGGGGAAGAAPAAPPPLFGGAPGPSPGGSIGSSSQQQQQQLLRQQQQQQQRAQQQQASPQHEHFLSGGGGGGGGVGLAAVGETVGLLSTANGHGGAAVCQLQLQQQQQIQAHAQFLQQQQQQQQQQHIHNVTSDIQRQQYNNSFAQQQQQQQQQLSAQQQQRQYNAVQYDNSGFVPASAVRSTLAAAPDGPRGAYDNRNPTGSYAMQNVIEMPYDVQLLYGNSGAGVMDLHQAGGFGAMGGGGGPTSQEYGTYGLAPLTAAAAAGMVDLMRAGSSGGTASTTVGTLQPSGIVSSTAGGFGGNAVGPGGIGRAAGGSPTMVLAAGAPGTAASRPSRSGNASAASMQDSRLGSFSTGPLTAAQPTAAPPPRRGSGNGGAGIAAVQSPFIPQRPSPPASDASGPSSSTASASTAGAAAAAAAAVGTAKGGGGSATIAAGDSASSLSMAAKLQQVQLEASDLVAAKSPATSIGSAGRGKTGGGGGSSSGGGGGGVLKAPADMPGRFRCLPPAVQVRIYALARDNHVVLLKDFDEKVLTKMTLLVEKFGAAECLAMLDRIEEVLKGKAGRLANGPGYLDVSVSTRLDELKQRASGQVTAPEDYARSTLHSRIYAELRDLISRHGFLQWHHFDQGIINMLKKMPNATALERLNELAYHSFKNVDNPKSCIVSIFTTKPKYIAT